MRNTAPADLQRWSEELARNPASLSFLPLARAHRRNGRRDLATRVCLRGLEHHPGHVEAHALLALLYLEGGDRDRAGDEWSMVLRLKPGNFEALRGMGFRYLEQNDLTRARQHLERAALIRPSDPAVQEALRLLGQRQQSEDQAMTAGMAPPPRVTPAEPVTPSRPDQVRIGPQPDEPAETVVELDWARPQPPTAESFPFEIVSLPVAHEAESPSGRGGEPLLELEALVHEGVRGRAAPEPPPQPEPWAERPAPEQAARPAPEPAARPVRSTVAPPNRLFDDLLGGGPLLGALLLDRRGLVLAGSLDASLGGRADELGAILGGAIDDAARTAAHLELGGWGVMLLETATSVVHVAPIGERGILAIAATHDAPTGWILRTAAYAAERAARFLEVAS
jgi:predicted regulator of Ras-like GTPase activity (Roadblock/LC7/MglB family)